MSQTRHDFLNHFEARFPVADAVSNATARLVELKRACAVLTAKRVSKQRSELLGAQAPIYCDNRHSVSSSRSELEIIE